ncbi:MAG: hypothetical protein QXR39_06830 [Candidatus Methanomethylicia archaeon]
MSIPETWEIFEKWIEELYNRLGKIYEDKYHKKFWFRYSRSEFKKIFREVYDYGKMIGKWAEFYNILTNLINWEEEFDLKKGSLIKFLVQRGLFPPKLPNEKERIFMEIEQEEKGPEAHLKRLEADFMEELDRLLERARELEAKGARGFEAKIKEKIMEGFIKIFRKYDIDTTRLEICKILFHVRSEISRLEGEISLVKNMGDVQKLKKKLEEIDNMLKYADKLIEKIKTEEKLKEKL